MSWHRPVCAWHIIAYYALFSELISNALQRSLIEKQNALEGHSTSLQEKSQRIEVQQRQVEGLLKQLAVKIPWTAVSASNGSQTIDSLMKQLKQAEVQLDEQERLLTEVSIRAKSRIRQESDEFDKKCKYLQNGMTEEEVRAIIGTPHAVNAVTLTDITDHIDRHSKRFNSSIHHFWRYNGRTYGLRLALTKTGILIEKMFMLPGGEGSNCN